jgi:hypothetical protein
LISDRLEPRSEPPARAAAAAGVSESDPPSDLPATPARPREIAGIGLLPDELSDLPSTLMRLREMAGIGLLRTDFLETTRDTGEGPV